MMDAELLGAFHFLRPYWLFGLLALPALAYALRRRRLRGGGWENVVEQSMLPFLLERMPGARESRWPGRILCAGLALALVALAGPVWQRLPQPVFRDASALVIALDLSRSMDATDVSPSRIERARHKLVDILARRGEGQTALIVYAGRSFVVSPLTTDAATIQAMVSSLTTDLMPAGGSRADRALELAARLIRQSGLATGSVLLLTDGVEQADASALAAQLRREGITVSVLGVGTAQGAPIPIGAGELLKDARGRIVVPRLDEAGLRSLAMQGGGQYSALRVDSSDLDTVLAQVSTSGHVGEAAGLRTDLWREEGPWLLLLLLPMAAFAFRRGWVAVIVLVVLAPMPQNAQASVWSALWARPDQRAAEALEQGRADEAQKLFEDPEWRATAAYRAGDFAASAASLEGMSTVRAHYNRGNALAMAGDIPGAIEAYREALSADPNHEDAAYNLELLLEQQQQQQQQAQDGQDGEQGQQGQENQEAQEGKDGQEGDSDQSSAQDQSQSGQPQDDGAEGKTGQEPGSEQQQAGNEQDSGEDERDAERQAAEDAAKEDDAEAQAQAGEEGERKDGQEAQSMAATEAETEEEAARATEQWLRRIPDDPGGLLRRKFRYQYRRLNPPADEYDGATW